MYKNILPYITLVKICHLFSKIDYMFEKAPATPQEVSILYNGQTRSVIVHGSYWFFSLCKENISKCISPKYQRFLKQASFNFDVIFSYNTKLRAFRGLKTSFVSVASDPFAVYIITPENTNRNEWVFAGKLGIAPSIYGSILKFVWIQFGSPEGF